MAATALIRPAAFAAAMLLVGACSRESTPPEPPVDPVVVYASYEDKAYLPRLFEAYTEATGVVVVVRQGPADAMVEDVIDNDISPPADVLLTPSVLGVYRAAEEGALRPIDPGVLGGVVPKLRDPDAFWTALSYRRAGIAVRGDASAARPVTDPAALARPSFRGRLCLSSSNEPMNRVLIANLIRRLGERDAEVAVRGWIDNLAQPVFASQAELLDALEEGACGLGLVTSGQADRLSATTVTLLDDVDVEGAGIARHARNPEGALRLIEWLLSPPVQERHSAAVRGRPVTEAYEGGQAAAAAWLLADAALLAERARYP